jgi:hypothetical protein
LIRFCDAAERLGTLLSILRVLHLSTGTSLSPTALQPGVLISWYYKLTCSLKAKVWLTVKVNPSPGAFRYFRFHADAQARLKCHGSGHHGFEDLSLNFDPSLPWYDEVLVASRAGISDIPACSSASSSMESAERRSDAVGFF